MKNNKLTNKQTLQRLAIVAMFAALSFVAVTFIRIPVVLFLSYEPKDVIITLAGFILGPVSSLAISLIVSLVEMVTISNTGLIGFVMNFIASASFACIAALFYKKYHNIKGAIAGLVCGTLAMTAVMLLWNYLITPLYMGYPREAVAELLIPAFLPFNLLKGGLNSAITMLIYKPLITALRKAKLLPQSDTKPSKKSKNIGIAAVSILVLATCIFLVLVLKGEL